MPEVLPGQHTFATIGKGENVISWPDTDQVPHLTIAHGETVVGGGGAIKNKAECQTSMDEDLQVVPPSANVCWSPSGLIYVLSVKSTRTGEVGGPPLTPV